MTAVDTRQMTDVSPPRSPIKSLAGRWAAGTGIAAVLVTLAFVVADRIAGPLVVSGAGQVTLGNVIGFTIIGGTVGATLAYLTGRFARKPRLTFLAVVLSAIAGYAVVPFTAAETLETAVWLNVFHLVVAVPVVGVLTRHLSRDRIDARA